MAVLLAQKQNRNRIRFEAIPAAQKVNCAAVFYAFIGSKEKEK